MSDPLIWSLISLQILIGAFDTLYHHEMTERLAWRPTARRELVLHGVRNLIYAVLFLAFGWSQLHGLWAWGIGLLLVGEVVLTLWDFVIEDRTRRLPASERVTHALLGLNYGAILALAAPVLVNWASQPSAIVPVNLGFWSALATIGALGVGVFGLRDLAAIRRLGRLEAVPAAALVAALPGRQRILVCGGTGLVGRRLIAGLIAAGHEVTLLTRGLTAPDALPTPIRVVTALDQIPDQARFDALVNLAGEPIGNGLWTLAKRAEILRSRVRTTRALVALAKRLERRPKVLVSASAIGWYGLWDDQALDEESDSRPCFTQRVCAARERAAVKAEALGVRVVRLRIGLVLAHEGGLLGQLLTPFDLGLGGPIGKGRQWMSWIERDDLVRLIVFALAEERVAGALNGTAPAPLRNRDFAAALGRALGRPAILPLPGWPLKLLLGDLARELLLGGQRVLPRKALANGFRFAYPTLDEALAHCLGARARHPQEIGDLPHPPLVIPSRPD
ncbi:MAG: TIGR01777 family oxidoreductase [Pseudomonadota bacterium]